MQQKVKLTLEANGGEYLCVRGVALVNQQLLVFAEIERWHGLCITDPCEVSFELLVDTGDQVREEKPVMFYVVTSSDTRYAVKNQHANAVNNVVQESTYDDLFRNHHLDALDLIKRHAVPYYEALGATELNLRQQQNAQYDYLCEAQNDAYYAKQELEQTKKELNCTKLAGLGFMGVMVAANIGFFALRAWSVNQSAAANCKPCEPCYYGGGMGD